VILTRNTEQVNWTVPTVDIGPYTFDGSPEQRRQTARAMDEACRSVGFAQIVGHGIDTKTLDRLQLGLDAFFGQGLQTKRQYRVNGANRGYSPPKSESLSLSLGVASASGMNDFFEAFNIGVEARSFEHLDLDEADYGLNVWPQVDGFQASIWEYFLAAQKVANTLTDVFADALGLDKGHFDALADHSIDMLRMINYALPEGTIELDEELMGMGEHTDYGIVTVLWADQVAGLQVLDTSGVWHDAMPSDNALLMNLGDLTARITNDQWMSTLHRVKPPIVDGTIKRRRSAAFFHDGNADAVVRTAAKFVDADGSAYEPISVRDHIAAKLAGSRQGKVNLGADREAARVAAAVD
jgi:isopenicillin N synthase-like dioxygenase